MVDYNKIQSFGNCDQVMKLEPFVDKWRSFGWAVSEIDGHDVELLRNQIGRESRNQPRGLIAHTIKGKGVRSLENTLRSHYQPINDWQYLEFLEVKRAK